MAAPPLAAAGRLETRARARTHARAYAPSDSDAACSRRQPGRTLWVDMETSLRTILKEGSDIFDANKAYACVRCVLELGLRTGVQAAAAAGGK